MLYYGGKAPADARRRKHSGGAAWCALYAASMRYCVYTSIYGDYDTLLQPVAQTADTDFICFTDAKLPRRVGAWRVIRCNLHPTSHSRMKAKYFKIMSHKVFPGGRLAWRFDPLGRRPHYDAVIWVDGNLRIKDPGFAAAFAGHIGPHGWSMFIHPDRDCIYDELPAAASQRKCWGLPLAEQVQTYRAEGFPPHAGLMAATLIARSPRDEAIARVNEAWWAENCNWSYRDQLSLPVVLWRMNHGYDRVMLNLWDNPWFDRLVHNSDL